MEPCDPVQPSARWWVIVVAGGGGARFGGPKQYVEVAGRRVIDHSIEAARALAGGVVAVVPAADIGVVRVDADAVVAGGPTRSASVRAGLAALGPSVDVVVVHDAARPAASHALFARVVGALADPAIAGAVPGVEVTDSLRRRSGGSIDRSGLVAVQTPQAFRTAALVSAHAAGGDATDDATLVEADGGTIVVVDGEVDNRKLTHPSDVALLEATMRKVRR